MNWSLMTYGAWDYPADARGYTGRGARIRSRRIGRFARALEPEESNGLQLNSRIMSSYGDVVEFERGYQIGGQGGRIRLLAFRNQAVMGKFSDAISQADATGGVPDLTTVRASSAKMGAGINIEHDFSPTVGLFARASGNDGKTETYAFTEIDRSIAGGVVIKGAHWKRPDDEVGIAIVANGLSSSHRDYLALGGLGFFLGDGRLNYRREQILRRLYSMKAARNVWFSVDYQYIPQSGLQRRPRSGEFLRPAPARGVEAAGLQADMICSTPMSAQPYQNLTPDLILDAVESCGYRCDGRQFRAEQLRKSRLSGWCRRRPGRSSPSSIARSAGAMKTITGRACLSRSSSRRAKYRSSRRLPTADGDTLHEHRRLPFRAVSEAGRARAGTRRP